MKQAGQEFRRFLVIIMHAFRCVLIFSALIKDRLD